MIKKYSASNPTATFKWNEWNEPYYWLKVNLSIDLSCHTLKENKKKTVETEEKYKCQLTRENACDTRCTSERTAKCRQCLAKHFKHVPPLSPIDSCLVLFYFSFFFFCYSHEPIVRNAFDKVLLTVHQYRLGTSLRTDVPISLTSSSLLRCLISKCERRSHRFDLRCTRESEYELRSGNVSKNLVGQAAILNHVHVVPLMAIIHSIFGLCGR